MNRPISQLAQSVRQGDRRSIARAISLVENNEAEAQEFLRAIFPSTGNGYRLGITGPPGAGKSTLTNRLAKLYRQQGLQVGVLAVDPTSPFTGGALLGDRVRMTDVELDSGVFIRSMASRGSLGGLSMKTREAADILDAAGHDLIIMETVGVGQSELDVARAADTTIVVLVPESGDGIQAMKAGLMEIADLFVMNKSDRPGAEQAVMSIKMILGFKKKGLPESDVWIPDVVQAIASEGKGIDDVARLVENHRRVVTRSGELERRRKDRLEMTIRELVDEEFHVNFWNDDRNAVVRTEIISILDRTQTPYDLAERLIRDFKKQD